MREEPEIAPRLGYCGIELRGLAEMRFGGWEAFRHRGEFAELLVGSGIGGLQGNEFF